MERSFSKLDTQWSQTTRTQPPPRTPDAVSLARQCKRHSWSCAKQRITGPAPSVEHLSMEFLQGAAVAGIAGRTGGAQAGEGGPRLPGRRHQQRRQRLLQLPAARPHGPRVPREAGSHLPPDPSALAEEAASIAMHRDHRPSCTFMHRSAMSSTVPWPSDYAR